MTSTSLTRTVRTIGELECTVVDTPTDQQQTRAGVVLCHGFGAPADDLVPCSAELFSQQPEQLLGIRFVFPAAPLQLDPSGLYDSRAWWPIDMLQLQEMMARGEFRDLRNQRPELLDERCTQMMSLITELQRETGLDESKLVLGGFSQGSMLTTEVALNMPSAPGGLIVWSGTLLNESQWRPKAAQRGSLDVVQTHGTIDPVLPFQGAKLLHDLFVESGFQASFDPFMGQHTISRAGIAKAAALIAKMAN